LFADPFAPVGSLSDLGWAFVGLIVGAIFIWVGLPLLVFVFEGIWLALLAIGILITHEVLRRPWTIEAHEIVLGRRESRVLRWQIVGWVKSRRAMHRIVSDLQAGRHTPKDLFQGPIGR
jgi:hypothetical protein